MKGKGKGKGNPEEKTNGPNSQPKDADPKNSKGKGKGKGRFEGECYNCGEYGHSARFCPKHKGKGKHVWANMFEHPLTPSRKRGGG